MSGHMTMTSRGSSVGSSASRCRIASRSTSTWRARPWQAWIWRLRSPGASSGRAGSSAASGARSSRTSAWMRASSVSVSCSTGWWWSCASSPITSCSSRESWPQEASSGLAGRALVGSAARRTTGPWPRIRSHRAGDGWSRNRWTSRCAASARSTASRPAGSRVRPNSERRAGRSTTAGSSRRRAQAAVMRAAGPGSGTPGRGAATARPASPRPRPPPTPPASPGGGAHSASNRSARWRTVANRRGPPACVESGTSHGSPRFSPTMRSSGHTARSGSHGSASGSIPVAAATTSVASRHGEGKSTFAHTPSPRPGRAPRPADEPLAQPPLHPARGDAHDLARERIRQRVGEQFAQGRDETVGPL